MDISSSLNILSKAKMECCGILWLPAAMSSLKKYMFVFLFGLCLSWDWVETYKVQLSNDSVTWHTSMNGTQEAVRTTSSILRFKEHRWKTDFEVSLPK